MMDKLMEKDVLDPQQHLKNSPDLKPYQQQTTHKTLKSAILSKLSHSSHKIHQSSNTKNKQVSNDASINIQKISRNLFTQKNLSILEDGQSSLKKQIDTSNIISPHPHINIYETLRIQDEILKEQSKAYPGFFEYHNWVEFNKKYHGEVDDKYRNDLWKILRIINYGEVYIPTGIIFELNAHFYQKKQSFMGGNCQNQRKITTILDDFLKSNGVPDRLRNFKQLKNYTNLDTIEQQFTGLPESTKKHKPQKDKPIVIERSHSLTKFPTQPKYDNYNSKNQDVWTRNFKDGNRRSCSKLLNACKKHIKQQSQCNFRPEIHRAPSRHASVKQQEKSSEKTARICHQKQRWQRHNNEELVREPKILSDKKIEALMVSKSGGVEQIAGVLCHIERNNCSYAQKLKVKRQRQRPSYSKNYIKQKGWQICQVDSNYQK